MIIKAIDTPDHSEKQSIEVDKDELKRSDEIV